MLPRQIKFGKLYDPKLFKPIENYSYVCKPNGGLWCSTYTPDQKFLSQWHEWCTHEQFRNYTEASILTIDPLARVYTIDTQMDLIRFVNLVGIHEPENTTFKHHHIPDFEQAAKIFDVIHLTSMGQIATRFPQHARDFNLYGWDVECCLVLRSETITSWEELNLLGHAVCKNT